MQKIDVAGKKLDTSANTQTGAFPTRSEVYLALFEQRMSNTLSLARAKQIVAACATGNNDECESYWDTDIAYMVDYLQKQSNKWVDNNNNTLGSLETGDTFSLYTDAPSYFTTKAKMAYFNETAARATLQIGFLP